MMQPPVIYIVDDDDGYRRAVTRLVTAKGYKAIAFANAEEFLAAKVSGHGCVLLDIRMPGMSGLQLQKELDQQSDIPPIIFVTGHATIPMSVTAIKAGADNFLSKPVSADILFASIETALARSAAQNERESASAVLREHYSLLTPREREVFELVIRGRLNKQIAFELGTSERTIKAHRQQVMSKMEAMTVQQLVTMAQKLGMSA
ncbi:MAG: response regulator [Pseudomonadota bacterium]